MYNNIQMEKLKSESIKKYSNQANKKKNVTFRIKCELLLAEKVEYKMKSF